MLQYYYTITLDTSPDTLTIYPSTAATYPSTLAPQVNDSSTRACISARTLFNIDPLTNQKFRESDLRLITEAITKHGGLEMLERVILFWEGCGWGLYLRFLSMLKMAAHFALGLASTDFTLIDQVLALAIKLQIEGINGKDKLFPLRLGR